MKMSKNRGIRLLLSCIKFVKLNEIRAISLFPTGISVRGGGGLGGLQPPLSEKK